MSEGQFCFYSMPCALSDRKKKGVIDGYTTIIADDGFEAPFGAFKILIPLASERSSGRLCESFVHLSSLYIFAFLFLRLQLNSQILTDFGPSDGSTAISSRRLCNDDTWTLESGEN